MLVSLAAQYLRRQAPSCWLLPLAGAVVSNGARLDQLSALLLHTQPADSPSVMARWESDRELGAVDLPPSAWDQGVTLDEWQAGPRLVAPQLASGNITSVIAQQEACDESVAQFLVYRAALDRNYELHCPARPHLKSDYCLFEAFTDQLRAELRAARKEQAKYSAHVQQAGRLGLGTSLARPRSLLASWSAALGKLLDEELRQARTLKDTLHNASRKTDVAILWPLLLDLGSKHVAFLTTEVLLQRLMSRQGCFQQADAKLGATPISSLAQAVSERLMDVQRWRALQAELERRQPEHAVQQAGRLKASRSAAVTPQAAAIARLRKLEAVLAAACQPGVPQAVNAKHLGRARSLTDLMLRQAVAWPPDFRLEVGSRLVVLAAGVATLPDGRRALEDRVEHGPQAEQRSGEPGGTRVLAPTLPFVHYVLRTHVLDARHLVDSRYMPMTVPSRPWEGLRSGGLLLAQHWAVRGYEMEDYRQWLGRAAQSGACGALFQGLNALGSTAWRINRRVLRVVQQLPTVLPEDEWERLGIPSRHGVQPPVAATAWGEPAPASDFSKNSGDASAQRPPDRGCTPALRFVRCGLRGVQLAITSGPLLPPELATYREAARLARQMAGNQLSLVGEHELRMEAARILARAPAFWFPHFVDFRGRAYPLTGYLTHQGDDLSRGLLEFAEGRPLGAEGLRWLLIQLANCYGHGRDKLSLDEREAFGHSCLAQCAAAANDPWRGLGTWWQQGEDPWQLLATALEVHAAVSSDSPAAYVSHMPVHQDGSCNGLQHYAALARDAGGAAAVNMVPRPAPQDVYSEVTAHVDAVVKADAVHGGHSEAVKLLARNSGAVDRKLIKQTVMTTVYGVTFVGARDQIRARLQERGWDNEAEVFQVSCYLAKRTLECVKNVFTNAEPVKAWLAACASRVAHTGQPVAWTSPLGFPIQQPYFKPRALQQHGQHGGARAVDKRTQRSAFPPNFIHSLDAAHMMMTAVSCRDAGITFAGVHDSFFTHAGSVDAMSAILRATFVQLHSRPLLQQLADEFTARGATELPPIPPQGAFDIRCVLDSRYFFS